MERLNHSKDDRHPEAQPAAASSLSSQVPSANQGTDSVRGTWDSEGEAGRHHCSKQNPGKATTRARVASATAGTDRGLRHVSILTCIHYLGTSPRRADSGTCVWSLNRHSAAGIDRVTWKDYEGTWNPNLEELHRNSKRYVPSSTGRASLDSEEQRETPSVSDFPPWKTKWSPKPWRCCWSKSTNKISAISLWLPPR